MNTPFTTRDAEAANRFSHYTTTPEKLNQEHAETMREHYAEVATKLNQWKIPETPENVTEALVRLSAAYVQYVREEHRARLVAPGSFFVGPSNYHGNHQRAETIRRNAGEQLAKAKQGLERALREHNPNRPIQTGEPDAGERLQAKIATLEERREVYKAINKILRKKLPDAEKRVQLEALGLSETTVSKLFLPDYAGRIGIPGYELTNLGAEIRRLKERLAHEEKLAAIAPSSEPFDGGRIEDNAETNRVQIFFDSKPDADMIARLKQNGFRWAPSVKAWQRQRSGVHVLRIARKVVGLE